MGTVKARLSPDGTVHRILADGTEVTVAPRSDWSRVDATTEDEIAEQEGADEVGAVQDAALYAIRVRGKLGLSQTAFARKIGVPVATVRNWEQGRRFPEGAARTLLRLIDNAPDTVLRVLDEHPVER